MFSDWIQKVQNSARVALARLVLAKTGLVGAEEAVCGLEDPPQHPLLAALLLAAARGPARLAALLHRRLPCNQLFYRNTHVKYMYKANITLGVLYQINLQKENEL